MIKKHILSTIFLSLTTSALSSVGKVNLHKGNVTISFNGKEKILKLHDHVDEGATIKTKDKSFVKIIFTDNTQINIGPLSELVITKFSKNDQALLSIVKGQIRANVTKQSEDKEKSKIILKTNTAAMGVRGTHFHISYNEENQNTALITFHGDVAFAKISESEAKEVSPILFENIISDPNRGVHVTEGLYSGAIAELDHATIPIKPSPVQISQLEQNNLFEAKTITKTEKTEQTQYQSMIPPGISIKSASNDNTINFNADIKTKLENVTSIESAKLEPLPSQINLKENINEITPIAGGYVDLKTAIYVPPPENSLFDHNTGVYIPPANYGGVEKSGDYKAPDGYKLNPSGQFVPDEILIKETQSSSTTNTLKLVPITATMPLDPTVKPLSTESSTPVTRIIASETTTNNQLTKPTNDVLDGGYFIPGNYFIDVKPTIVEPPPVTSPDANLKVNFIN